VTYDELIAECDGGSRGNPGPAAFGVSLMTLDGEEIEAIGECIGRATNNVAEYSAAIRALHRAKELGARRLLLRSDSLLLIQQLRGNYKVKHAGLIPLHREAVTYEHVRREFNKRADELVNIALDAAGS